jgi:peptidoglycan-binding protein ArfA
MNGSVTTVEHSMPPLRTYEKLSQQRASTVGEFLVAQGLASDRVTTRGYGAGQPVASNDTREGRRQNRRVELVVAGDVIATPPGASR